MTLQNSRRLLETYEALAKGVGIPENNKDSEDVMANAKHRADLMRTHIEKKTKNILLNMNNPGRPHSRYKEEFSKTAKKEVKKDGKKPT